MKASYILLFNSTYKCKVTNIIRKFVCLCIYFSLSMEDKKSVLLSFILNLIFSSLKYHHEIILRDDIREFILSKARLETNIHYASRMCQSLYYIILAFILSLKPSCEIRYCYAHYLQKRKANSMRLNNLSIDTLGQPQNQGSMSGLQTPKSSISHHSKNKNKTKQNTSGKSHIFTMSDLTEIFLRCKIVINGKNNHQLNKKIDMSVTFF